MAENQQKFHEAERAIQQEADLRTELDTARAELESARTEHARVLDELTKQHDADLQAKDLLIKDKDLLIKGKDEALLNLEAQHKTDLEAAIKKAEADAVEAYKTSDEFQGFGLEYLERGIRTACRWVVLKFGDVVSSVRPSLEGVQLDDPLIAEALNQVEAQVQLEGVGTSEDHPVLVIEETIPIDVEALPSDVVP